MAKKKKYYAYMVPGGSRGVTDDWKTCEGFVSGKVGARFMAFNGRDDAERWLMAGARYEIKVKPAWRLEPGVYFDAGTGRGKGVEISVTDEKGKNLLHKVIPKKDVNRFGKHLVGDSSATNNYGELLALRYALAIAKKTRVKKIFGDSKLVIEYWSRVCSESLFRYETPRLRARAAQPDEGVAIATPRRDASARSRSPWRCSRKGGFRTCSLWHIKSKGLPEETVELAEEVSTMREVFESKGGSVERIPGGNNPADLGFHR